MTEISRTSVQRRTAWRKSSTAKLPSASRKASRLSEARLHAVSSRNMYSEHGFDALMRPSAGHVCHSLTVVSYCTPGSAHDQAAKAISFQRSRALSDLHGFGVRLSFLARARSVRQYKCHGPSFLTASMKPLVIRTELLLFWPETV